jgi:hypothetical protein
VRNPEAPRLVGAYRRAVPKRARRIIAQRVDADLRKQVKLRIADAASAAERVRAARIAKRHQALLDRPGRAVVTKAGEPRIAELDPDLTPLATRRENLRRVLDALAAAGLEHFCVRGRSQIASAVAVRAEDRTLVLNVLAAACAEQPGYVVPVRGNNRAAESAAQPGFEPATWRRLQHASVLRVAWYRAEPTRRLVLGLRYGCDIEFWREEDGRLVAPRAGRYTADIAADSKTVEVPDSYFTSFAPRATAQDAPLTVRTREPFAIHPMDEIRFPIDAVYTWVDGSDPLWLARRARYSDTGYHEESANAARWISRDELRYSLRSLHLYAPWLRHIYLVTADQVPAWLDTSVPGLTVVPHREIFRSAEGLPTFNSHAIESQLHHIEGLSEHFLYFNDDMMLGRETVPQDFFLGNGTTKFFPSPAFVPLGERTEEDPPVAAAGKNNRRIVETHAGTTIIQKMKHVPYALRRSVLAEIEETFPEAHHRTAISRFRGVDDISIASSLHHYYAYDSGRAVPGRLSYAYVDLAHPYTEARLGRLLAKRDRTVFCVNDTVSTGEDTEAQKDVLTPFLADYFPVPSPFERRD